MGAWVYTACNHGVDKPESRHPPMRPPGAGARRLMFQAGSQMALHVSDRPKRVPHDRLFW